MEIGRLWQLFCANALQNSGTPHATFRGFTNTFSYIETGKYNFVNFYLPFVFCFLAHILESLVMGYTGVPLATEPGISLIILPLMRILQ
jgi:hypothetical protein